MSPTMPQTVGRQAELTQLRQLLDKGIDTLVLGPVGVGKSHLLHLLEVWFALTSDLQLVYATRDYTRAVQRYARAQGIDPATVAGPTHCASDEQELAERLALAL